MLRAEPAPTAASGPAPSANRPTREPAKEPARDARPATVATAAKPAATALREPLPLSTPDLDFDGVTREPDLGGEDDYIRALALEPWDFDFFAAVRRVEALRTDLPGVGRSSRAEEDPMRFGQEPSLAFAPCNLWEYRPRGSNSPARLFVNFLGLLGPNGAMPIHITEHARERQIHHKDHTFARFMDIFNHRMVSLFYRAWASCQMTASFDRWEPAHASRHDAVARQLALARDQDAFARYVASLFGMGMDSLRHRDSVPDLSKLHFAGRLANQVKNPEGLRAILRQYLGVDVEVEEFQGRWTEVPGDYHMKLGRVPAAGRSAGCIGATGGVVGASVFDCSSAFRMRLGPMTLEQYQRMLPGTRTASRIAAWVRNYVGDEFWWEANLILKSTEVPKTRLGAGTRLGWTSWIHSGPSPEDRADLALRSAQ